MIRLKKILLITVLLLLTGIPIGFAFAQSVNEGTKPDFVVSLSSEKSAYPKGEPPALTLTMENREDRVLFLKVTELTGLKVFSWDILQIIRSLRITGPGGNLISNNLPTYEPPPGLWPTVSSKGKEYSIPVMKINPGEKLTFSLGGTNFSKSYTLDKTGRYSVIFRTIAAEYDASSVIEDLAIRGEEKWSGLLESNTIFFEITDGK